MLFKSYVSGGDGLEDQLDEFHLSVSNLEVLWANISRSFTVPFSNLILKIKLGDSLCTVDIGT